MFVVWAVSHLASCCHQGGMLTAFKLLMHLLFAILVTEVRMVFFLSFVSIVLPVMCGVRLTVDTVFGSGLTCFIGFTQTVKPHGAA